MGECVSLENIAARALTSTTLHNFSLMPQPLTVKNAHKGPHKHIYLPNCAKKKKEKTNDKRRTERLLSLSFEDCKLHVMVCDHLNHTVSNMNIKGFDHYRPTLKTKMIMLLPLLCTCM